MSMPSVRLSILVAGVGLALALLLSPAARSQLDVAPSYVPIGVSSSGSTSTAWFHQPATRQALACQTVTSGSGLSSIQCVTAKLP
jgi:hypothetical protein